MAVFVPKNCGQAAIVREISRFRKDKRKEAHLFVNKKKQKNFGLRRDLAKSTLQFGDFAGF
jgi:hypothetical protein